MIVDEGNFNESSYDSSRLTSIKATASTVGDIHEPLVQNIGEIKFGVAFFRSRFSTRLNGARGVHYPACYGQSDRSRNR